MPEEGKVALADPAGGSINAAAPSPVRYSAAVVQGRMPNPFETVCFTRNPNNREVASRVRVGSCAVAAIAAELEGAFHSQFGDTPLAKHAQKEVFRMSADRAERILLPMPDGAPVTRAVKNARLAMAVAAMKLMAVEAMSANYEDNISAKSLRDVLRAQRPKLPR